MSPYVKDRLGSEEAGEIGEEKYREMMVCLVSDIIPYAHD